MKHIRAVAVAGFLAATLLPALAMDISGAGATFPYPIYAKWADAYKKETGVGLNYQSIGSGGGIKQIEARTVTFGATDAPLSGAELDKNGLAQFPMVMGAIVPVVNLEGIKRGRTRHRRAHACQDFPRRDQEAGTIRRSRNSIPAPSCPSQAIAVVHRSDGSGTTFNFAYYLSKVSADWKSKVGFNTSVEWPVGIGAKGNEGVSNNVGPDQGLDRLCRVRLRPAEQADLYQDAEQGRQDRLSHQRSFPGRRRECGLEFGAGLWRDPGQSAGRRLLADDGCDIHPYPQTAEGSAAATAEALKFFAWAYAKGAKMAEDLVYVPMPPKVVTEIEAMWSKDIKDGSGQPLKVTSN